ncbi:hypothetical protein TTHERM_000149259 (macronuclear) [Tetrahymena thermophila SB210]|uniref:Biogenesis of lysosome-related organelles complex 1 subunit 7 n=1 Tax=Tetrahymena thermophila (strain SB210) TaxID=312017 RepID=W7XG18_TETTS|nr:hypothetical protein TTHERM_000149259 [Tetrahymena thermophila SB210]EWS73021.1 hypothetical protein TTHERM_000149259 [Tetrahymena thermophila SB210]|eukprot:XP_012654418.1 hypothetical protein TTHERM_000149259 [Tetrahymena thermophila SB210]
MKDIYLINKIQITKQPFKKQQIQPTKITQSSQSILKSVKMEEQIKPIFEGMLNFNLMFTDDIFSSQDKLKEVLDDINNKLVRLQESGDLDRDKEINEYIEKISLHKKRLETLNKSLMNIQTRVDKIEQRYILYKKNNKI